MLKNILRFIFIILTYSLNSVYVQGATHNNTTSKKTYSPPQSALVLEYSSAGIRILHQQNANAIRHPASLTKMMTVYMILEAIQTNRIKPNTLFRVSKFASMQMPSKLNLKPGSYISAIDCVKALLVKSANDVAVVVAEGISGSVSAFCKEMNRKAKVLGMHSTHFENPSGLPDVRQVTSANDISKLGIALYTKYPKYWKYFALKNFSHHGINHATHCKILNWYKGADGAKTGFINASGFNLWVTALRYTPNGKPRRLFAVVFGGSSGKLRDFKAASLMDKFFKNCSKEKPNVIKNNIDKPLRIDSFDKSTSHSINIDEQDILFEIDSVPISEVIKTSGKSIEYFEELYKEDGAPQVIDKPKVENISSKTKRLKTSKHKKKHKKCVKKINLGKLLKQDYFVIR